MIALFYVIRNIKERRIIGNWIFFILLEGKLLLFQLDKKRVLLYIQNIFLFFTLYNQSWENFKHPTKCQFKYSTHDFKLSIKYV